MSLSLALLAACAAAVPPSAPLTAGAQPTASVQTTPDSPALTIYNQDFAVVRDVIPLTLQPGVNSITYGGMTARLEPDSVILRDSSGKRRLQILEQNYRNDPVTQERLLDLYEGQAITFRRERSNGEVELVLGRIVRSGYTPPRYDMYGNMMYRGTPQPVIEVNGALQFQLP